MEQRTIEGKTLWLWLGAGILAPVAQYVGGRPWPWILALALGAGGVFLCAERVTAGWRPGKVLAAAELGTLLLAGAWVLESAPRCWPTAENTWVIALTLLVLGVSGAAAGNRANSRGGAGLFWPVALGLLVLTVLAMGQMSRENLYPTVQCLAGWELMVVTLPGLALLLPRSGGRNPWLWALGFGLAMALTAVVTAGVLGGNQCHTRAGAFYEMTRSIRLLGNTSRLEPVAAALVTLGWYCLLSLILGAAGEMLSLLAPAKQMNWLWPVAGAVWLLRPVAGKLGPLFFGALGLIFWYMIPAAGGIRKRKLQKQGRNTG